jgi:hypothetical protein
MSITIYQVEQLLEQCTFKAPIPSEEECLLMFDPNYIPLTLAEAREGASKKTIGMSGEANGMYGRKQSDKQKKAASDANKIPKPHVSENMKKRHAEGKAYQWTSKDNPRSRAISGDGVTYDCIADCQRALGFKNHNAITYRVKHPKWTNWFYV